MNTGVGGRLVGVAEIAADQGVSGQAVSHWVTRYEDFPEPVVRLAMGPVWMLEDIHEWVTRKWDI